jgi:hypothetical protein
MRYRWIIDNIYNFINKKIFQTLLRPLRNLFQVICCFEDSMESGELYLVIVV